MTRRRRILTGGIGAALIAALGAAAPQMWSAWLEHRREVMAMEQSAGEQKRRALCERDGGKWWRGECLEVYGPEEEP